jgi:hypothetical protein
MNTATFARLLEESVIRAALWVILAVHSFSIPALAESAGLDPGPLAAVAEVSPEVRQSWEEDFASLKAALSNRDNPHARLKAGDDASGHPPCPLAA